MGFNENLKAQLLFADMQVKELAARSGVNKRTVDSYLDSHRCMPSAEAAVKIARVLGVSVEYLITGEDCPVENEPIVLSGDLRLLMLVGRQLGEKDRGMVLQLAKYLRDQKGAGNT